MNGTLIFLVGACVGLLLRGMVRRLADDAYAVTEYHFLRRHAIRSLRRVGRILLAAVTDDKVVYDWFLGPRRYFFAPRFAMPILLTGGPAHGKVLKMGLRTGDLVHIPMPGKAMNSYGVITEAQMRKADYRVSREMRKAFYIGTT